MYKFEQHYLKEQFPTSSYSIKSSDQYDQQLLPHYRRGHAGVAAVWSKNLDPLIEAKEEEGSERVLVCILGKSPGPKFTVICTYMPAGNTKDELTEYAAVLDEVHELTLKYASCSTVVWLGDMNGSFTRDKPVGRDKLLTSFCNEVGYTPLGDLSSPSFYPHSHQSTSRIDHILQLSIQRTAVTDVEVLMREPTNVSPHDPIIGSIRIDMLPTKTEKRQN